MNVSLATLSLTRNLQELAAQIAAAPGLLDDVRAAMRQPDVERLVQAKLRGHRHIKAIAMTTRRIKMGVVGVDDLGPELGSLSELVLRAIRLVVLSEMTILRTLWQSRDAVGPSPATLEQETGDIYTVDARLRDALDEITRRWCACRGMPSPDRAAYRTALRAEHQATRALARDLQIARFLDAGTTRIEWPAFRESCTRLRDALLVQVDVEPDSALLDHSHLPAELQAGTQPNRATKQ